MSARPNDVDLSPDALSLGILLVRAAGGTIAVTRRDMANLEPAATLTWHDDPATGVRIFKA